MQPAACSFHDYESAKTRKYMIDEVKNLERFNQVFEVSINSLIAKSGRHPFSPNNFIAESKSRL